jgi:ribulose-phosphate 3-epimerase
MSNSKFDPRSTPSSKTEIIPAIMASSYEDLASKISAMNGIAKVLQIDVMDGKFVDSKSWPYIKSEDRDFIKIIKQEEGLPEWQDFDFEIDLMIRDVENEASKWIAAGATRLVIHYKSEPEEIIKRTLRDCKEKGVEVILDFELDMSIEEIIKILHDLQNEVVGGENKPIEIDGVQVMGIDKIGFQGEKFDHKVLSYIREIKKEFPDLSISVDGGIKPEYARPLSDVGANRLVIGSAIYSAESPRDAYEHFRAVLDC